MRGLLGNIAEVTELLLDFESIDILTVSEMHITTYNEYPDLYNIPGYNFVSLKRSKGKGGGVGMFVSDRISWQRRLDLENKKIECIWIEIFQKNAKSFLLSSIYRPPDSSKYLLSDFNYSFDEMLSKEFIIMGDMNINYLKKTDHREIKSIIRLYGLVQLITKPTRTTEQLNTLIDIICSTNPSTICKTDVIPLSIGDHDMVGLVRKLNHLKYAPRTIKCRNYTQYHPEKMCDDLKGHNWEQLYLISDVNNAWNFIKDILSNTFNKHAPMINKRVKGNFCPWLTSHIKALMNERDKKLQKSTENKERS